MSSAIERLIEAEGLPADYREIAYWFGLPQIDSVYIRGRREA